MITKPPPWIMLGGILLSFIAGYVNAIGFLNSHAITHMTGLVSQMAIGLGTGDLARAAHLGAVILSFFGGCVLSGVLIQQSTLKLGRRYGAALMIEALFLFASVPLLNNGQESGYYLAAFAFGLQNAMASTYSGAIVRTTHLTGFINDFGIAVGHLLRGWPIDFLRFRLYGAIFLGFLSGGVAGVWLANYFGFDAFYFPATLLSFLGVGYFLYAHYLRSLTPPIEKIEDEEVQ